LPSELITLLLSFLDVNSLQSFMLTCRKYFKIFKEGEQAIMKSIISQIYYSAEYHEKASKVFAALVFTIQHEFIGRDAAQAAFERGWSHLKDLQLEQLLIPVGRGLAWSYVLDHRSTDAICLLTKIWDGSQPFGWSTPTRPPKSYPRGMYNASRYPAASLPHIQPLEELLNALLLEVGSEPIISQSTPDLRELSFAVITPQGIFLVDLEDTPLPHGILFEGEFTFVRLSNPPRSLSFANMKRTDTGEIILEIFKIRLRNSKGRTFYRPSNRLLDEVEVARNKILAHQPLSDYTKRIYAISMPISYLEKHEEDSDRDGVDNDEDEDDDLPRLE
jgi:hypothetical protein